jgi:hypothetical protein
MVKKVNKESAPRVDKREKVSAEELISLRTQGLGVCEIAKRLGLTSGAISKRLKHLGLGSEAIKDFENHQKNPAKRWESLEHRVLHHLDEAVTSRVFLL